MERYFQLTKHGTTARREWLAGLTTFVTMAYILFVNPAIMAAAGLDREALVIGTIFAAVLPTVAMGVWARLPWALAPGMGYNALFAYTVVTQYHLKPATALALVFLDGAAFLTLLRPLTYSIAEGMLAGILSYLVLKTLTGRAREIAWPMWLFGALLIAGKALETAARGG